MGEKHEAFFGTPTDTGGEPVYGPTPLSHPDRYECAGCRALRRRLAVAEQERDEAQARAARLYDDINSLECDIASAFGWKMHGEQFGKAVRRAVKERDEALRINTHQAERLRNAQARVAELEARLYGYADEAHRLYDCLRAYDRGGIPMSDARGAFGLLRKIEQDAGLRPMDERSARQAAEQEEG